MAIIIKEPSITVTIDSVGGHWDTTLDFDITSVNHSNCTLKGTWIQRFHVS